MENIRVRFAPSPTGPLHIGGARSALFNYLFARKHGGRLVFRMEDTDLERSSEESGLEIMESLRWLGLDWDEGPDVGGPYGPYSQMQRLDIYNRYVDRLLDSGQAYRCYCSEEELEQERQELMAKDELPRYLGKCRTLTREQRERFEAEGRKAVIRFRVPEGKKVIINDLVRGEVVFESSGIGDFVIVKSSGIPTYNFAVAVDDHEMKINYIIRAEEHLSNTPRQLLLYEALGFPVPQFAHVSLILGKNHAKMSKRHGATSVEQYRRLGYLPEALVNFLALLGWASDEEREEYNLEELVAEFSLDRVSKSPAVFDLDKLKWLNGVYVRKADLERLARLALPYLQEAGYASASPVDAEFRRLKSMVDIARNYVDCLSEIPAHVHVFFTHQIDLEGSEAAEVLKWDSVPDVLRLFSEKLRASGENPDSETVKRIFKEVGKELGVKGKQVFMPVRVALTGEMHGPELDDLIPVLGTSETVRRLETSVAKVTQG